MKLVTFFFAFFFTFP
ncbi:TPA: pheA operon leader peptide PheL [Klebsiella pneumoniae]|nr:pheA operon leader peptide PheL [Klebsiella pneumoniae]HDS9535694.1 pheA operon leader peptide PheL [Klebsiella pneumoniae subsp. pneumoniae]MCC5012951.1 pheA operon leader peptide PheL [Klebsiella pneumoniae]MCP6773633.1 pheA operon leader peptide PheL [Klebsiella pneumoniae]MCQ0623441.1 pheA operon leader peptide PheL [Klebsiella pneumoniae]MCX9858020.1 pheA operon leader peptide PheL [Klebsiella pneumoniae]